MNAQPFEEWLNSVSAHAEVLACGVRFPDSHCISQSFSPAFPTSRLNEAWRQLTETVKSLTMKRMPVNRLCWKYSDYRLEFIIRHDGLALGLVLNPSGTDQTDHLDELVRQFHEIQ